ncbi:MAG: response regulator [Ignavibacteria bacterium]|jgi:two-component SAPR family response regulator|nr:response regulator [Ignavibacteria bacterium]
MSKNNYKRYLIVDDDKANNMLCKMILQKTFAKAEVISYDSPREALNYINNHYLISDDNFKTVIFLDINMPDITGWEFLDIFKDFNENIRNFFTIYMLSSSVDYKDKNLATENPLVEGYIEKPLTREKIKNIFSL